jgi:hypothetical protein
VAAPAAGPRALPEHSAAILLNATNKPYPSEGGISVRAKPIRWPNGFRFRRHPEPLGFLEADLAALDAALALTCAAGLGRAMPCASEDNEDGRKLADFTFRAAEPVPVYLVPAPPGCPVASQALPPVADRFSTDWPLGMKADLVARRVKRGDNEVDLSDCETAWKALVKLVRNHPTPTDRGDLWTDGPADEPTTELGSVYNAVSTLRRLIGPLGVCVPRARGGCYALVVADPQS